MIIGLDVPFVFQNCTFRLVDNGNTIFPERYYEFKNYTITRSSFNGFQNTSIEILLQECNVIDGVSEIEKLEVVEDTFTQDKSDKCNKNTENDLNNVNKAHKDEGINVEEKENC